MADQPAPPRQPEKPIPNNVSKTDAIRALTANPNHPPLLKNKENGVYIITYCLDLPPPSAEQDPRYMATNIRNVEKEEIDGINESIKTIEAVTNIKFRKVSFKPGEPLADISFFKGTFPKEKDVAGNMTVFSNTRDVIIGDQLDEKGNKYDFRHGENGYYVALHELMHALGLSHPGDTGEGYKNGGKNPLYNRDATSMSYISGELPMYGIGPFDIAALQFMYGTPHDQNMAGKPLIIDANNLPNIDTVYAQSGLASLDFSKPDIKIGNIQIDMSAKEFHKQIRGLASMDGKTNHHVATRIALDTQLQDVLTSKDTNVQLTVKGNALPNKIQGGKKADYLTAIGGNDVLTGRGGNDTFIFTPESGKDNLIADFTQTEDWIKMSKEFKKIELVERKDYKVGKVATSGTEILFSDDKGKTVSSVFVPGMQPSQLKTNLTFDGKGAFTGKGDEPEITFSDAPVTPPQTPNIKNTTAKDTKR